jgi:superfamily I DNA/RNA helicase
MGADGIDGERAYRVTTSTQASAANLAQREAITTSEGPLLIIAGPGSGKTFTLVERIVYLLTQKSIAPEHIMVVTFTDKAAQELTTRISNRLDQLGVRFNLNEMYLGTFHAICLRWLQEHRELTRLKHNFTVLTDYAFSGLFYELLRFPLFSRYLEGDLLKGGLQASPAMRNLGLLSSLLRYGSTYAQSNLTV